MADPKTDPNGKRFKCPECGGVGDLPAYDVASKQKRQACGICYGLKWVGRETYDRWRRRQL